MPVVAVAAVARALLGYLLPSPPPSPSPSTPPAAVAKVTEAHRQQYKKQGFFVLENAIPADHLKLLRDTASVAVADMEAEMDRKGTDTLGINHRGKR
jgi:hypothetical protein